MQNPIAIDLFCGIGGFTLGFLKARFDVRVGVDNSTDCGITYWHNFCGKNSKWIGTKPDTSRRRYKDFDINKHNKASFGPKVKALICTPIEELTGDMIREAGEIGDGEIHTLMGGPPCQGFSMANWQRGIDNPRNKCVFEFIRMVRELHPKFFCFENVPGLCSMGGYKTKEDRKNHTGRFLKIILQEFVRAGYIVNWALLNAKYYGVPQDRKRVFIIGRRMEILHVQVCTDDETFQHMVGETKKLGYDIVAKNIPTKPDKWQWK